MAAENPAVRAARKLGAKTTLCKRCRSNLLIVMPQNARICLRCDHGVDMPVIKKALS